MHPPDADASPAPAPEPVPTPVPVPAWPPRRLAPVEQLWLDRSLVVVLLVPVLLFVAFGTPWLWVVLGLLQIGPLWWRRDHPVAVFAAVSLASSWQVLLIDTPLWSQLAFPVALYSVARFASGRAGLVALGIGGVASVVSAADWARTDSAVTSGALVPYLVTSAAISAAAWALGTLTRTRTAYVEALVERNERIEREAAQRVALAATDERARIAREMHDVVAHGLTVMIVQADGARYAAAHNPEAATAALTTIARTGRESLADMRRMLGLLRSGDTGTAPTPELGDLTDLVRDTGVRHRLEGLDRTVPTAVALTTYRVVQEALTNVRKHAGPEPDASVVVSVGAVEVLVDVRDHGRGAAAAAGDGAGHGLIGMRERVEALDGVLTAGPAPGGGFGVSARIPL